MIQKVILSPRDISLNWLIGLTKSKKSIMDITMHTAEMIDSNFFFFNSTPPFL